MKAVALVLVATLAAAASAGAASAECTDTSDRLREAFLDGRASAHLLPDRYLIGPHEDVSPDGSRLLYGDGGFIVERLDGSSSRRLSGGSGGDARWSPDGTKIAYVDSNGRCSTIWVRTLAAGRPRRVSACGQSPAWSRDSRLIAFVSGSYYSKLHLAVVGAGGGKVRWLVRWRWSGNSKDGPFWSPQGDRIAYVDGDPDPVRGVYRVRTISSAGGPRRLIGVGWSPSWSPDGTRLVLNRYGRIGSERRPRLATTIVDRSGHVVRELKDGGDFMAWSPRGDIAYARYDNGGPQEIFVMRADGTRPRQITHDGGNINARVTRLVWANGGRRLLYFRAICDE